MVLNLFFLQVDSLLVSEDMIMENVNSISIIDLFFQGGAAGQFIIVVLFMLSIITMYLFFERLFSIKKALKEDNNRISQLSVFSTQQQTVQEENEEV